METGLILRTLLLYPTSIVLIFVALAGLGFVNYLLVEDVRKLPARRTTGPDGLLGISVRWWRILRISWKRSRRQTIRIGTKNVASVVGGLVAVAFCGILASLFALTPYRLARSRIGVPVENTVPVIFVIFGFILAVVSFIRAAAYVYHPDRATNSKKLPKLSLHPTQVSWTRRVELARGIYFYHQLQSAVAWSSVGALFLVTAGITDPQGLNTSGSAKPATPTENLYGTLLIASIFLAYGVKRLLDRLPDAILPTTRAALAIHACLHDSYDLRERRAPRLANILDPLGRRRVELSLAADSLMAAGRRIDAGSPLHPVASVIRGCAVYIRRFLARTDSLAAALPADLVNVLDQAVVVIAGPRRRQLLEQLAKEVSAFGVDGAPQAVLRSAAPSRWSELVGRTADSLDRYSRVVTPAWTLFTFGAVVVFIATGRLDLTSIQIQK